MKKTRFRIIKGKGPVKHLDRTRKAQKIYNVILDELGGSMQGKKVLDIGCGNGQICREFNKNKNKIYGVDIEDVRKFKDFQFSLVDSATLPYENDLFDIIISNHTIEHIPDQARHLDEIYRVLKPDGIVYIATPNKTSPLMQGHVGNQLVVPWRKMQPMLRKHNFSVKLKSLDIIKNPNRYYVRAGAATKLPRPALRLLCPLFPSHIFILRKSSVS